MDKMEMWDEIDTAREDVKTLRPLIDLLTEQATPPAGSEEYHVQAGIQRVLWAVVKGIDRRLEAVSNAVCADCAEEIATDGADAPGTIPGN